MKLCTWSVKGSNGWYLMILCEDSPVDNWRYWVSIWHYWLVLGCTGSVGRQCLLIGVTCPVFGGTSWCWWYWVSIEWYQSIPDVTGSTWGLYAFKLWTKRTLLTLFRLLPLLLMLSLLTLLKYNTQWSLGPLCWWMDGMWLLLLLKFLRC